MKKLFLVIMTFSLQTPLAFSQSGDLKIGDLTPEIILPGPDGDSISLSSLRGKIVLIDFWASWCSPCVKEQPELADLYRKYKDADFKHGKGFEIYGVSLDSKRESWKSSIKKLKINWAQVSDLEFWSSPVARTYNLQKIPANFLIDSKGNIIAKDLHGNALEEFISNLLLTNDLDSR